MPNFDCDNPCPYCEVCGLSVERYRSGLKYGRIICSNCGHVSRYLAKVDYWDEIRNKKAYQLNSG